MLAKKRTQLISAPSARRSHKYTSSTPIPRKSPSPSPSQSNSSSHKGSLKNLSFQKADLRKGIFSNKQISCKKILDRAPMIVSNHIKAPTLYLKSNKYLMLSKEYNIDKTKFKPRKVDVKICEKFYITEKPPLMNEKRNPLSSNSKFK